MNDPRKIILRLRLLLFALLALIGLLSYLILFPKP
jgi:hypothetical protein